MWRTYEPPGVSKGHNETDYVSTLDDRTEMREGNDVTQTIYYNEYDDKNAQTPQRFYLESVVAFRLVF
jgi:hypothetical protein